MLLRRNDAPWARLFFCPEHCPGGLTSQPAGPSSAAVTRTLLWKSLDWVCLCVDPFENPYLAVVCLFERQAVFFPDQDD